ncbi:MAG TPA: dihydrofolate reductase family protein [Gaiellaceae bacterium]|jgi:riboflavin biosynthesis pyrimidine reductase|nr:dihydrofolate reductase family protein [Gaiellaceae bacterium]
MTIRPLERLWEAEGLPTFELPAELGELYGGPLGFEEPRVFANFVSTADGVVAIPSVPKSNRLIAAGSEADRFVLGLLRACADVLVIGRGTLAASPRSTWSPAEAFPAAADAFAELRRRLGRSERLEVAVLSRSGLLDLTHPAFAAGAVVITTDHGAAEVGGKLPAESVISLGPSLDPGLTIAQLKNRGHRLILHEGGPHAIGPFFERRLIDELFLTISPVLAGRDSLDRRLALVEDADLLPGGPLGAKLLGIRMDGDHVFLRYRLDSDAT